MPEAVKHDQDKEPLALIDPEFPLGVARVLAFGANKYSEWNWAEGTFAWSRLLSAMQRHILAFQGGEELDKESGLPHLDHAACCLMFLRRYASDGLGKDDRFIFKSREVLSTKPFDAFNPPRTQE